MHNLYVLEKLRELDAADRRPRHLLQPAAGKSARRRWLTWPRASRPRPSRIRRPAP